MSAPTPASFDLATRYLDLRADGSAREIAVTPDFWEALARGDERVEGRLVAVFPMTETWPHWERHPAGEELVYCLSGALDLVLDLPAGEHAVALRPGLGVLVPAGIWHRGVVHAPGDCLFVTPGEGTEHRPL
jgi:quercetin dioxygenase-like cupin family protein